MEKGDVGLPDPELDPATNSRLYGKPVTFQVIDAIKGCEDGETITYWELGGEAPDGNLYVHPELCTGEVGGLFLLILNGPDYYYIPSASTPLPANEDGTLSLPDGFLDLGNGAEAFSTDESITMEAYIDLLQERVLELTPEDAPSDVLAEAKESGAAPASQAEPVTEPSSAAPAQDGASLPVLTEEEARLNLFPTLTKIEKDGVSLKNSSFLSEESAVLQAEGMTDDNLLEERDTSRTFQKPVSVEALSAEGTAVYTFSHSMLTHVSWMFFFDSAEYDSVCQSVQEQAEAALPEEWRSNSGSLSDHHVMRWAGGNGNELKVSTGEANDGQFVLLVELTPTIDPEQFAQLAELYTP